ncbi:hypothetical protein C5167_018085 [Papaver somniferum]|uniref:Uncharacterized protein n=1 Tax=Papaver somniferum TaxID=3469 RepID=A0A4Y7IL86_PAPSO|nr:hypothetical protein C5167_018085 [Papaver somniferum]
MENSQVDGSNRPSLCFPLCTALLLILVFSVGGINLDLPIDHFHLMMITIKKKTRILRLMVPTIITESSDHHRQNLPKSIPQHGNQNTNESMPVIMPGDNIAKFIALRCPCKPFRSQNICATSLQLRI